jgi:hypothetical protein
MTFRSEWASVCISNISTAFPVYAPFTTSVISSHATYEETIFTEAYEYTVRAFVDSSYGTDGYFTSTFSNISTMTSGLIAGDPIVVGWQQTDLSLFPTEYVSSLAHRYSISWSSPTSLPTPASRSNLPNQTNAPNSTPTGLSTGAKAGIGVGVAFGVLLVAATIIMFMFRRRRNHAVLQHPGGHVAEMEDRDEVLSSKKWYLFGKWRNEMAVENQLHELDSTAVDVVPGSLVEMDTLEQQQREVGAQNTHYVESCRERELVE